MSHYKSECCVINNFRPIFVKFCSWLLQTQEGDKARLAEELGAAKARESDSESRKKVEFQKLSEEQDDIARKYQSEV